MTAVWIFLGLAAVFFLARQFYFKPDTDDSKGRSDRLRQKYSTEMNRLAAGKEAKASLARTEAATQLNEETKAVLKFVDRQTELIGKESALEKVFESHQMSWESAQMEHEHRKAMHQSSLLNETLNQKLIGVASEKGMDVATLVEVRKKYELDRLELDRQWKEAEHKLRAGFIYQLQGHQHLDLLKTYLFSKYEERKSLADGNDPAKEDKLNLLNEHIKRMEHDFRERQRLISAGDGQEVRGGDQNTEPGGDAKSPVEADTSLR